MSKFVKLISYLFREKSLFKKLAVRVNKYTDIRNDLKEMHELLINYSIFL